MSIRLKIVLIVVPLIVATLLLTGVSSFFSATNSITRITKDFLGFKADELRKHADNQWWLLVENSLTGKPEMVAATQSAVEQYAESLVTSPTEMIVAFKEDGAIAMATSVVAYHGAQERDAMLALIASQTTDLVTVKFGEKERVSKGFWFEPFGWYVLVTEERSAFYDPVNEITMRTGAILAGAILAAVALVLVFARYLTRPLTRVVTTMKGIISTNDLSHRVVVEYHDEIGQLAQTFNLMVGELEKAYGKIKGFAFDAVVARKREQKIRNIFQRYVPKDVIERVFVNPESMLVGENRELSVLFSDIRGFTTISEGMSPDDLVDSLNRYFSVMVDIIMARGGIVDKYIGDAIMAFFGAPVNHEDDALQSVLSGIEMAEALDAFNTKQRSIGKPEFRIGVGINYGLVTVGNIGTDKKMDYTVIGDMVNLASRLEGLTKTYHQGLIISETVHAKVKSSLECRELDSVAVKGKTRGVKIYSAKKTLTQAEARAWSMHNEAMGEYYARRFGRAAALFQEVQKILPGDEASQLLLERCRLYAKSPPPRDWDGVEVMKTK